MLKIIEDFKVELKGELITVYKNGEIVNGKATRGATADADFKDICEQVQRHIEKKKDA
tara:strand:- start:141 stop:314 length:174 start_codon:yes stop_codon:yes gene_type:complete